MSIAPIERDYLLKKMRKEACEWRMKELAKEIDDDAAALFEPLPNMKVQVMPPPPSRKVVDEDVVIVDDPTPSEGDGDVGVHGNVPTNTLSTRVLRGTTRTARAPPSDDNGQGSAQRDEGTHEDAPNPGNPSGSNPNNDGGDDDGHDGHDDDGQDGDDGHDGEDDEDEPSDEDTDNEDEREPMLESSIPPEADWGDDLDDYVPSDDEDVLSLGDLPSEDEYVFSDGAYSDDDAPMDEDKGDDDAYRHASSHAMQAPSVGAARPSYLPPKPKAFTGIKKKGSERTEVTSWLNKWELYFSMAQVPKVMWVNHAYYMLESPAFEVVKARIKNLKRKNKWHDTWEQFCELLVRQYGDVEENLALRAKLRKLVVRDGNMVSYARVFQETANRISVPLSDDELISDFFHGIKDRHLLHDVLVDPRDGRVWKEWDKLYSYVMDKYSVLKAHDRMYDVRGRDPKRRRDEPRGYDRSRSPRRSRSPKRNRRGRSRDRDYRKPRNDRRGDRKRDRRERGDRRQGDKDKAKVDMETTDPTKLKVGQRLSEEQRDELSKQKRCFYCFKEGHNREHCPARKSRERK